MGTGFKPNNVDDLNNVRSEATDISRTKIKKYMKA